MPILSFKFWAKQAKMTGEAMELSGGGCEHFAFDHTK